MCKYNSCPDCSPNKDCYCDTTNICINCVNLYTEDKMYKTIKVECNICKKILFLWTEV